MNETGLNTTQYELYLPLGNTSLRKGASYEISNDPLNPALDKTKKCGGGLIAVAVITTLAVVGLLIIAIVVIIWVMNGKKKNSVSSAIVLSMPIQEQPLQKLKSPKNKNVEEVYQNFEELHKTRPRSPGVHFSPLKPEYVKTPDQGVKTFLPMSEEGGFASY